MVRISVFFYFFSKVKFSPLRGDFGLQKFFRRFAAILTRKDITVDNRWKIALDGIARRRRENFEIAVTFSHDFL